MRIIPMSLEHLDAVADLERQCFSLPWSWESFAQELENPNAYYVVVMDSGRVLGYAGMRFVMDEFYVDNIAVAPDCRRQGIGRSIMRELIDQAVKGNARFLSLEVRPSNEPAVALYRQMGFIQVGLRKGFYDAPKEDGAIMTLFFDDTNE